LTEAKDLSGRPPRMTSLLKSRNQRSFTAAAGATLFLLLGLGVVWFARKVAGINDGAVLSVLVIIPALLYVVLRGDLAELRGPGGWGATFRVTKATVNFGAQFISRNAYSCTTPLPEAVCFQRPWPFDARNEWALPAETSPANSACADHPVWSRRDCSQLKICVIPMRPQ
jgi:hypothetical protein